MAEILTKIAGYGSAHGAEIAAFDPSSDRLFVVAGSVIEVLDLSNLPANPTKVADLALDTTGLPNGYDLVPNSVTVGKAGTVSDGIVAVALAVRDGLNNQESGQVQFFNAADGSYISTVTVGYLPDMVTFTPDGTQLLTANEGEPNESYTVDPEGSISIIDISAGVASATVTTLDFNAYDDQRATLQAQGVKLFGEIYDANGVFVRNSTVSEDLEPEYIAISPDGTKAYVTLQENNAVAVIDIASKTIDGIQPLGFKDYSRGLPELTTYDITNRGNINNGGADLLTADGETIELGGFSGLFYDGVAQNGNLKFLTLPDRGPNGDPVNGDRPFLLPDYQARIVSLELNQTTGEVIITDELLLTRADGTTPITGLPNIPNVDERAVDSQGNPVDLPFLDSATDGSDYDPLGADLEGIVRAGDGTFWAVDEYRPAIYHFDTDGSLIDRFIPIGTVDQANTANPGTNYAPGTFGTETLPADYLTRRSNRGFEGIALDTDNGILYAFIQTPLANPNSTTSNASNVIRMIGIDPTTGNPVSEYIYLLQKPEIGNNVDKIGDATYAGNGKFYVMERDSSTDSTAQKFIFEVNLTGATNVLGLDLGGETLEQQTADDLAALGINPVNKIKVTNLPSLGYLPTDKSEGLTVLPDGSLAVINDNDFGVVPGLDVVQLGIISFSGSNGLDASDRDGGINITNQPVFGVYQPDSIAAYTVNGESYYITANEGDARNRPSDDDILGNFPSEGDIFSEEARIKDLTLDPTAFPNASALQADEVMGRLNVTTKLGDIDGDGDYDQLFAYGGRSFSIWDSNGNQVFDSGNQLEEITATNYPNFFNASNSNNTFDNRSDDKGPEPEGVTVGTRGDRTYAYIGLERIGGVMVYDVTDPAHPTFVQYANSRDFTADPETNTTDSGPEGLLFIPAADSPTGNDLVVVSNEVSQTVSVLSYDAPFTLQILNFYGESGLLGVDTAPIMGALIDKFDDEYVNTLVLGEGDSYIPGPWLVGGADPSLSSILSTSTALGRPDIAIMNAFGTDATALGNHEFDLGSPVLQNAISIAQFPLITSNLDFSGDSSLRGLADESLGGTAGNAFAGQEASDIAGKIAPYTVVTQNGEKIGIVGVTTYDLLTKTSPNGTVPLSEGTTEEERLQYLATNFIQPAVDALTAQGVNKIILVDQLDTIDRNRILAPLVAGIDIMVAGGGHERLGDENDTAAAFNGHDADFVDTYPIQVTDKDGNTTLIVTTDTEYTYLGRLVVNFDENGEIIVDDLDSTINGAYASTEATLQAAYGTTDSADTIIASSAIGSRVKQIADAIDNVIISQDSEFWGYTNVYLEGDRVFGRSQEVNLGDITADANLYVAQDILGTGFIASLKNAGGIRASIGSIDEDGAKIPPIATEVKPANAISTLDIENALRFNNRLMVFDVTPEGLKSILEHAAGLPSGSGGYMQIGGIRVSFDPDNEAGSKVETIVLTDLNGNITAFVYENGAFAPDAPETISMVALNFTANGGDGYPIKDNGSNFRYLLTDGTVSAIVDKTLDFTAESTFATLDLTSTDILGEQAAFKRYLQEFYGTPETAYSLADTPASEDERIQNLNVRADSVTNAPVVLPFDTREPAQMVGLNGYTVDPIFTVGESFSLNGQTYTPPGILDGLGAFALDEDTVRVYANHELSAGTGYAYTITQGTADTSDDVQLTGARVSYFDINKNTRQLESTGLAYDKVYNRAGNLVTTATDLENEGFDRFCSAQYIEAEQFGVGRGLADGIFFTGEETDGGTEFALDPNTNTLYALPWLGRAAWESVTELDTGTTDKIALLVGDDRGGAPLLLYVGAKDSTSDHFLARNGLTNGQLYVWVADSGETTPEAFNGTGQARDGSFVAIDYYRDDLAGNGEYDDLGFATQEKQDELAAAVGAFQFSRPEDVATNPANGTQAVMASTGRDSLFPSDRWGTTYIINTDFGNLDNITANIKAIYDGDDAGAGQFANSDAGLRSPDNVEWSDNGWIYVHEDRSYDAFGLTSGEEASIWRLNPYTGELTRVARMDRSALPDGQTDRSPDDIGNWESSGIIDVSTLFGEAPGQLFLFDVQAHSLRDGVIADAGLVQGGQLAFLDAPDDLAPLVVPPIIDPEPPVVNPGEGGFGFDPNETSNQGFFKANTNLSVELKIQISANVRITRASELVIYEVDDETGSIEGKALDTTPGSDYQNAIGGRILGIMSLLEGLDFNASGLPEGLTDLANLYQFSQIIDLAAGKRFGFLLVEGGSYGDASSQVFLSHTFSRNGEFSAGGFDLKFEGSNLEFQLDIKANDYAPGLAKKRFGLQTGQEYLECLDRRGEDSLIGQVRVYSEAAFDNLVGFYRTDIRGNIVGADGTTILAEVGSNNYFETLIQQAQELAIELKPTTNSQVLFAGNALLSPFIIADGNFSNYSVDRIFTPFRSVNSDGVDHFRLLGSNTFAVEDQVGGGDLDFDDMIIQVTFS